MATLTLLGAARTVTGSKYLVKTGSRQFLVDCGLFQGLKELRERNWQPLPVDPSSLDAVVITHAHIDHTGYLPKLVRDGFRGRIFCTPGTADLCRILLPDAGRLAEEDAREANRQGYTKHAPALPLFTEIDAQRALGHLQPVGYLRPMPIGSGVTIEFLDAGHLLGSAFVRLTFEGQGGRQVLFSGDLGRYSRPVLPDPTQVDSADVLLVESTYGDRLHEPDDDGTKLAEIVKATAERGGKLIIPSFAVGRVEEVIYWLKTLEDEHRIPVLPVYLDSPMAVDAMKDYARSEDLDPDMRARHGRVSAFSTRRFTAISTPQASKELVASTAPCIVISSSGMATGGRVLYHLKAALPNPRDSVLFVGYQAAGTRGRSLVSGEKQVKIHGQWITVAAQIAQIDSMSAHADANEIMRWLHGFSKAPEMTCLVHGEPAAQDALKARIEKELGWPLHVPDYLETVTI